MEFLKRLLSTAFLVVLTLCLIGLAVLGLSTLAVAFRDAPEPMAHVLGAALLLSVLLISWHLSNPNH